MHAYSILISELKKIISILLGNLIYYLPKDAKLANPVSRGNNLSRLLDDLCSIYCSFQSETASTSQDIILRKETCRWALKSRMAHWLNTSIEDTVPQSGHAIHVIQPSYVIRCG